MANEEIGFEMELPAEVENQKDDENTSFDGLKKTEQDSSKTKNKGSQKGHQVNPNIPTQVLCRRLCLQRPEDQRLFHQEVCTALEVLIDENSNNGNETENATKTTPEENVVEVQGNDEEVIDYQDEPVGVYSPKFMWFLCRTGLIIFVNIAVIMFVFFIVYFGHIF